jgi:hypothetical protein
MIPAVTEIKPEPKIEQQEKTDVQSKSTQEAVPPIKTEENQANWKAFREQREADRKARQESEKRAAEKHAEAEALKAALEALTNKPAQQYHQDAGDIEESEEQRIDRRVKTIIDQREREQDKIRAEKERQEYPNRLNQVYPDFGKTVSAENLDYLDYHYPEVSRPLQRLPDDFDKWSDIYNAVKKFVPQVNSQKETMKAEKNLQKPGSISQAGTTTGTGQMPSAILTEERKQSNYERMMRTMKGIK